MELLKRKIDKYLLDWKNNPERKPLIVKGRAISLFLSTNLMSLNNYDGKTLCFISIMSPP